MTDRAGGLAFYNTRREDTHTHTPAHHHTSWDNQCSAKQLSWLRRARPSCKFSFAALSRVNSALPCMPLKSRSRSTFKTCAHRRRTENPHSDHASLPLFNQLVLAVSTCTRSCAEMHPSARKSFAVDIFPAFSPAARPGSPQVACTIPTPIHSFFGLGCMFNAIRVKSDTILPHTTKLCRCTLLAPVWDFCMVSSDPCL